MWLHWHTVQQILTVKQSGLDDLSPKINPYKGTQRWLKITLWEVVSLQLLNRKKYDGRHIFDIRVEGGSSWYPAFVWNYHSTLTLSDCIEFPLKCIRCHNLVESICILVFFFILSFLFLTTIVQSWSCTAQVEWFPDDMLSDRGTCVADPRCKVIVYGLALSFTY